MIKSHGHPMAPPFVNPDNNCRLQLLPEMGVELTRLYNQKSFLFPHGLSSHPLLTLPSLVALAGRLEGADSSYWSSGPVGIEDGWAGGRQPGNALADAVANIACNDSLIMLKGVANDSIIGPLLKTVLARIIEVVGPKLGRDLTDARATILIASPGRVTAYHADSDVNFLMQVAGDKQLSVFDPADRTLVTEHEIERFLSGEEGAIRFKPERQQAAIAYNLCAGAGVHVPCLAPHWAQNGNAVSIAVSFNFDLHSVKQRAVVSRVNQRLRRFGLRPASPGDHEWMDQIKYHGARAISALPSLRRA